RQLPEDWTGAVFQGFEAAEIFSQALAGAADFQDVRDEAAAFDGEDKAGRRLVAPAADHFERGQAVEGGVDFDGGKLGGVELELAFGGDIRGIEMFLPFLVNPPAGA